MTRKIISILIFIIGIGTTCFAQDLVAIWNFGFGPRFINMNEGIINTSFVDESPSMDNLSTSVEVSQAYTRIGLNTSLEFGKLEGMRWGLFLDSALGENQLNLGGLSFGNQWVIMNKKLWLSTNLNLMFSSNRFEIGQLRNTASYIQINGKRYSQPSMKLRLRSNSFAFGPEVKFNFKLLKKILITGNLAYDFGLTPSKSTLIFIPSSKDESIYAETSNQKLDINNPNLNLTYNGSEFTSLGSIYREFRITIGVANFFIQ